MLHEKLPIMSNTSPLPLLMIQPKRKRQPAPKPAFGQHTNLLRKQAADADRSKGGTPQSARRAASPTSAEGSKDMARCSVHRLCGKTPGGGEQPTMSSGKKELTAIQTVSSPFSFIRRKPPHCPVQQAFQAWLHGTPHPRCSTPSQADSRGFPDAAGTASWRRRNGHTSRRCTHARLQ